MPAKLPKKPVPKVEASSAPSTETGLEARRPAYIIVFRERSPANTKVLAAALDVNEAKGVAARDSRTILQHNHEWAVRPRVYERMGLAVADLDPSEIEELQKSDSVAAIVPNRERRVPPIIEHTDPEVAYSPVLEPGRIEPPVSLREPFVPPPGAEFAFAYASGIRDAAEMVLRAFRPSLPSSGLAAIAGSAAHSWCLNLIGIDEKYSRATGRGVRVAVLDTGIDLQHPDFQGRFIGGDGTVSFVPGETVQDGNGHGTHCAGVIGGAARPNGGRRYGVAPDAELLIGKVLSDAGRGHDDQIIEGIDWAADAGAQVISMSLGSPRSVEDPYSDPYEVVAANYLAMVPGTLIVAAAGNESARPSFTSLSAIRRRAHRLWRWLLSISFGGLPPSHAGRWTPSAPSTSQDPESRSTRLGWPVATGRSAGQAWRPHTLRPLPLYS